MVASPEDDAFSFARSVSIYHVMVVSVLITILLMGFVIMCLKMAHIRQKTRSPQQRRMYVGSRARPSLGQPEPTIYVSPSNLPPPPKYECMAPPSYEEVVGVHYPQFQAQPITQPITSALAQSSSDTTTVTTISETRSNDNATRSEDAITVPRTVPVATSSS
ncbi:uncharacterized protein LOC124642310 isoform X4 [Helicoverpa zea]|uniref:uncharacterized protein LOC124642310 isoform X4 n=1 Tax=Helicoverpa zea TaxID=7113 RepID=UPI001F566A8F|nr:uncharacterized protein LOC124642310 isoform X4 [Helicoverpa zea]